MSLQQAPLNNTRPIDERLKELASLKDRALDVARHLLDKDNIDSYSNDNELVGYAFLELPAKHQSDII